MNSANVGLGIVLLALSLLGTGCMSPMALNHQGASLDLSTKSIAVFTLSTSNAYRPFYNPNVQCVRILSGNSEDRKFRVEQTCRSESGSYDYLVSVDVQPGAHTLKNVMGNSFGPLVMATFDFPVEGTFQVPANSVTYVGHVEMVNRERQSGETRSGSIFPLVDQAVAGYSGGTFDVTLSDRSKTDIPLFTQNYPCLQGVQISTAVMHK